MITKLRRSDFITGLIVPFDLNSVNEKLAKLRKKRIIGSYSLSMNTVLCPQCKAPVEISEALKHQIQDQVLAEVQNKHKKELENLKKDAEEKATKRIREELEFKLKDSENEIQETRKRNKEQHEQLLALTQTIRDLKQKDEERELAMQKKLDELSQKAKDEAIKSYEQEHRLKDLEKDKKINDMLQTIEELKRKGQQGSQQLQGEVQELDLEEMLRDHFRDDEISAVGKGITGADIRQVVRTKRGNSCGEILIESKRTKAWSDEWVNKLKTDVRAEKASIGVIVTSVLPKDMDQDFGFRDGIYITLYSCFLPFMELLRDKLREVAYQKYVSEQSGEKADVLYDYLTGHEFRQQIEALAEVYQDQLQQITKERAAFERIWKARELQTRKMLMSTANIYGSVQGIVGKSLLQVKSLDLLDDGEDEQLDLLDK